MALHFFRPKHKYRSEVISCRAVLSDNAIILREIALCRICRKWVNWHLKKLTSTIATLICSLQILQTVTPEEGTNPQSLTLLVRSNLNISRPGGVENVDG